MNTSEVEGHAIWDEVTKWVKFESAHFEFVPISFHLDVGWIATQLSKSFLVAPIFTATPKPWHWVV